MSVPKLRFKEFDGDWTKVSLDKVSKVFDGTHQTPNYVESGIKFVSVENIHAPYDSDKFITVEAFKKDFKNQPQLNDILMTRITAGEIGATAIVDDREPLAYYVSLALIRPKAVVTTPFLNQYIGTPFFKNELHKRIIHVAFPKKINLGDINECLVSLPDKQEEQTKIASFLSAVDDKISQLTQKHELLSQYKQGMMQKLFSQQIRFKADDGGEFGEWENYSLNNLLLKVVDNRGKTPETGPDLVIPLIEINAIGQRAVNYSKVSKYVSNETFSNWFRAHLEDQDILFSTVGNTAICSIYSKQVQAGIAQNIIGLRAKKELIESVFLYYLLTEDSNNKKFKSIEMQAVQPSIKVSQMIHLTFLIPCFEEQIKIANFLSAIDEKIEVVAQQIEQAKLWKKGLLQQMFV